MLMRGYTHTNSLIQSVNIVNVNEGIHTYKFTNSVSLKSSKTSKITLGLL